MYQALYRKYRPSNFQEVVGQKIVIETLKNAIRNNKISHAYLFTGPRGTGKTSIAKILAKTVNCQFTTDGIPCGKCVVCTQIDEKRFTDIIEIDAASNNGVDEIREIRNKVNLVPSIGKYKVYIIDEVHMLTQGAFNALLKTLEEPPGHIIFVLATTEPHKIPTTILSRCQRFDFRKIGQNQIFERLKYISEEEKIDITDEAIKTIAMVSDGGMRDSINLLDQVNSYKDGKIDVDDVHQVDGSLSVDDKIEFIQYITDNNIIEILKLIDKFNDEGKNLIKVLEQLTITLKNILLLKVAPNYFVEKSNDFDKYKEIEEKISEKELISLLNNFNNNLLNIKQSNDLKLAVELLMIEKCSLGDKNPKIAEKQQKNTIKDLEPKSEVKIIKEEIQNNTIKQQENISEEHKITIEIEPETPSNEEQYIEEIEKIINRRVENTLARFKKQQFQEVKNSMTIIEDYITDEQYNKVASLIVDGELKAASDEYLLFVYDADGSVSKFNSNIPEIETFIYKIINKRYKVASVNKISWEIIKKEFNSKEKEYKYEKEDYDFNKIKSSNNKVEELTEYFENIIEYE